MIRDLAGAWRWLRRNPLFSAAVVAILAIGIGANTAVFSIVDAVLLQRLPYPSADRLVRVEAPAAKRPLSGLPAPEYLRWRDRTDLFEKSAPYLRDTVTLTGPEGPDQVIALRASGGLFAILGTAPQLGRTLIESDDAAPNFALLSDRLWRRRYHADPHVTGRAITVAGEPYTIAGVMPPSFDFPSSEYEMWLPLQITPASSSFLQVIARRQPAVSLAQVQSAMQAVALQLEQEDPQRRAGLRFNVTPWTETTDRKYELTLVFVLAAVGLVLLIACADVGGLLLSRAVQRQKEIAIRASLGAGGWRIVRQLLAESLVLAVLGSAAGIAIAKVLLQVLAAQLTALPIVLPHLQRATLNGRVLLFNTALCLLLALLCSLAPVLVARRTDIQMVLRGYSAGSRGGTRIFSFLIASQAAFAFLLLAGSGLMIRSLIHLQQEDRGIRPDHVLTMRVPAGSQGRARPSKEDVIRQMEYYGEILDRVQKVPGVRSAAVVNNLPLSGVNSATVVPTPDGERLVTSTRCISPQYFAAMGTPLIAGRIFTDSDRSGSPEVAIINQYLARQIFPGRDPLGQALLYPDSNQPPMTIIGVVKDAPQLTYEQPVRGEVYRPYRQAFFAQFMASVVVRTAGDPLALAATLRKEVWAVDPNQPVVKVETMNDLIAQSIWRPRFSAWIFSVLGGLAVLLISAGVYGVVSYTSALRVKEVGIRVALGAAPRNVVAVILQGAMVPLAVGVAAGIGGGALLGRLLSGVLYGVEGTDPAAYAGACALVLLIGALASLRPAWRAATADPLESLKT